MTGFDENQLTKGQLRKLEALRKSLGVDIANEAFGKWIRRNKSATPPEDPNAVVIAEALMQLIQQGKLRIPRGGYRVRRGRGKVIVDREEQPSTADGA